jgi:predicted NodU family carbamoyl transferase
MSKILGINISHDTSVALVDEQTGEVLDVYEEERAIRNKYYNPHPDKELQVLYQHNMDDVNHVVFSSFDRRDFEIEIDPRLSENRELKQELVGIMESKQLSRKDFADIFESFDEVKLKKSYVDADEQFMKTIGKQLGRKEGEYAYGIGHHIHHAYSGYHLSPYYKDDEDALIIVWDGGGCRALWDEYPTHQEIESIYHGTPDGTVTLLWQRLSNHRFHGDMDNVFPNDVLCITACLADEEIRIDDVDYVLTSKPSAGMNFSNMSAALGTDELGRAAGKVMGMASYGRPIQNVHDQYTVSQNLELDSFAHSCEIIRTALNYLPDSTNIVLSGGYSLNCTNNYKYLQSFPDINFFVDPVPHDGGTAVGCALEYYMTADFNNAEENDEEYVKQSVWSEE